MNSSWKKQKRTFLVSLIYSFHAIVQDFPFPFPLPPFPFRPIPHSPLPTPHSPLPLLPKPLPPIHRRQADALFDLGFEFVVVEVLANEDDLVFGLASPFGVVEGEAFAAEVEDVAFGAFVEPEDAFGAEDGGGKLVVEEVLEFLDGKGAIALKRNRGKAIHFQVVGMVMVMVMVMFAVAMVMITGRVVVMVVRVMVMRLMVMRLMIVMSMVVMVMIMVSMIVMVMPRLLRGEVLVRLEEADAEDEGEGHLGLGGAEDSGTVFDVADFEFQGIEVGFVYQVSFVEQDNVAVEDLVVGSFAVEEVEAVVFGIDEGDDRIEPGEVAQFGAEEGEGNGEGIGESGGFDHEIVDFVLALQNPIDGIHQVVVDGAADAAVAEFYHVVVAVAQGDEQLVINTNFAKLVDQYCRLESFLVGQDVIQQRGLTAAQEAGDDGDREAMLGAVHGDGGGGVGSNC